MVDLSIVIPCFNEAASLPRVVEMVAREIRTEFSTELVLVNNGSTDDSDQVCRGLLIKYPFARMVRVEVNQGYGHGILAGLASSRGEVLGWTHSDLQTDPADVIRCYDMFRSELLAGSAIVKGRRVGREVVDRLFTSGMSWVASLALGGRYSDVNAQPKLFHRSLFQAMQRAPKDFSLDLYLLWLSKERHYVLREYPVVYKRRPYGEAKGGGTLSLKWKLARRTLRFILELRRSIKSGGVSDDNRHTPGEHPSSA